VKKKLFIIFFIFCFIPTAFAKPFSSPPISIHTLSNGFKLYLLEDHHLPLIETKLFIKVGDAYEEVKLAGLADIMTSLLVTGGTKSKSPKEVDEWLDERAVHLTAEAGRELSVITLSCLSKQWEEAFNFLVEVLLQPRWDQERFELTINRYLEELRRDDDEPGTVAERAFREELYGAKHPWGKSPTLASIGRIRIEDIKKFYQSYFQPSRMLLTVSGDFSSLAIKKWLEKWASSLQETPVQEPKWEKLPLGSKSKQKRIHKKVTQSFIEMGHLGLERHSPDEFPFAVLQYILGGEPFTSRLGRDIRSDRGLAYSVYSHWDTNPTRGYFRISLQTRADAEEIALEKIKEHLVRISQQADITPEELALAKESLLNKYIFWFDSPFHVVALKAKMDLLGFEKDYLSKYPERMKRITLEQVKEVAKKYIQPDGLKVVIVGP